MGRKPIDEFLYQFEQEAKRVDAFFAPELDEALSHTAMLAQRTADYVRTDIACEQGMESLVEGLTGLVKK